MTTSTQWQLVQKSAERYQTILTPAILGPFAQALVAFAALQEGESVVDVGCGTGAAARHAATLVGAAGKVTGIDVNPGMLAVAQSLPDVPGPAIAWREASATQLPLPDGSVDVVLCAQTLQFLPDKQAGLAEMKRVLKQNGRIALSLWCDISENPYFDALVAAVARHVGPETAAGLQSAFALKNADDIQALLREADMEQSEISVTRLDLPFADLAAFVPRHVSATPMDVGFGRAAPAAQQAVVEEVVMQMGRYGENGRIQIPFRSHMIRVQNQENLS